MNQSLPRRIIPLVLVAGLFFSGLWGVCPLSHAGAPQNVILMIGDGLGLESVWAAGAYQFGSDYHKFGGQEKLNFEKLAGFCWMTTHPLNLSISPTNEASSPVSYDPTWTRGGKPGQLDYPRFGPELSFDGMAKGELGEGPGQGGGRIYATDSGSSATSMACGIKTYLNAIGMDNFNRPCKNIMEKFQEKGKKTGVVTSVQFSHATPAGFAAHNVSRKNYWAIAEEMIRVNQPEVIMGAGHPAFDEYGSPKTPEYRYLAAEDFRFLSQGPVGGGGPYSLVETREQFLELKKGSPPARVFGLIQNQKGLKPALADGSQADPRQPTLKEMSQGALAVLSPEGKGFFLMIEGGAIDRGHHHNDLNLAIGELFGFQEAVQAVLAWIEDPQNPQGGWDKNLLIVTADHETGYLSGIGNKGRGVIPDHLYNSKEHTNRPVGVWYQGAGMEFFQKYLKTVNDFERGEIQLIDNTDLHKVMEESLQAPPKSKPVPQTEKKDLSSWGEEFKKAA
jgi:alkaline phosphatase